MKAILDFNSLEVWVECNGVRLKEHDQTFEEKRRNHPPTYKGYLEIGDPSTSKYTFHVTNTAPLEWSGHLLSDVSVDDFLLCTTFLRPQEGYEVFHGQVYHPHTKVKGGEDVQSTLVAETDEDRGNIVLLNSPEGGLGKITISIWRGIHMKDTGKGTLECTAAKDESVAYNGSFPRPSFNPSNIWDNLADDDIEPWVRFVYTYGTRQALEANEILTPSVPAHPITPESEENEILIPDSTPPSPFLLTTDQLDTPREINAQAQSCKEGCLNQSNQPKAVSEDAGSTRNGKVPLTSATSSRKGKEKAVVAEQSLGAGEHTLSKTISDNQPKSASRVQSSKSSHRLAHPTPLASSTTHHIHPPHQPHNPNTRKFTNHPRNRPTHQQNEYECESLPAKIPNQAQAADTNGDLEILLQALENPASNLTEGEIDYLLQAVTHQQELSADRPTHPPGLSTEGDVPHNGGSEADGHTTPQVTHNLPLTEKDTNVASTSHMREKPLPSVISSDYAYPRTNTQEKVVDENDVNSIDYLSKEGIDEDLLQSIFNPRAGGSSGDKGKKKASWETVQSYQDKLEEARQRKMREEKEARRKMRDQAKTRRLEDKERKRRDEEREKWLSFGKERSSGSTQRKQLVGRNNERMRIPVKRGRPEVNDDEEEEMERRVQEKKRKLRETEAEHRGAGVDKASFSIDKNKDKEKGKRVDRTGRSREDAIEITSD